MKANSVNFFARNTSSDILEIMGVVEEVEDNKRLNEQILGLNLSGAVVKLVTRNK
jgi:hypothetical protein